MNTVKIVVQKDLVALSKIFNDAGFSLYLVGGALRDMYLKRANYDIDVATDAKPEDVVRLFRKTIPTGIKHGTVTIRFRGRSIECTTLRREAGYSDARHPDIVEYGTSITDDLSRRDFTMNAIAASLPNGEIIDPYNGRKDIKEKMIRAVGEPLMRFAEDGLRPMRAIRFVSQLGFEIEEATLQAIPLSLEKMKGVSIERFQDEFNKMIKGENFARAMILMRQTGVMELFLPKLNTLAVEKLSEMLRASYYVPRDALTLRLSLICYWIYEGERSIENEIENKLCGKDRIAIQTIETMLKALKYPNKVVQDVLNFVQYCNFDVEILIRNGNSKANIRRFLKAIGRQNVDDIFILKKAIVFSKMSENKVSPFSEVSKTSSAIQDSSDIREIKPLLEDVEQEVRAVLKEAPPLSIKELALNGEDLLKAGIPKGPQIGKILNELLNIVIEKPENNEKEELTRLALEIFSFGD